MLYRIDTYTVPDQAVAAFNAISEKTVSVLRLQPGFVRANWYEKAAGAGSVNVVTIAEWVDEAAIAAARAAVADYHRAIGFDAAAFVADEAIWESKAVYTAREETLPA